MIDEQPEKEDADPEARVSERQDGIIVHVMFERPADSHDLPNALDAAHIDMNLCLLELEGVAASYLDTTVQNGRRHFDNTFLNERSRWIRLTHDQTENEPSLTGTIDGQLVTDRIDRTFIAPTGTIDHTFIDPTGTDG